MTEYEKQLCELGWWAIETQTRNSNGKLAQVLVKDFVLHKWSARKGTNVGCRYWSKNAINHYLAHGIYVVGGKRKRALRHEHVVPRKVLTPILLEKSSIPQVFSLLSTFCVGCILTKEEDRLIPKKLRSAMPEDWDGLDVWARYRVAFRDCGITIWKVDSKVQRLQQVLSIPSRLPQSITAPV